MKHERNEKTLEIMIVEDEAVVATDLESLLLRAGYRVSGIVDSGADALALAARARPDLAFVDIRLRGAMDGIELARRLRAELNVAVIFATAHGDASTVTRASGAQPFGYVVKPFEEQALRIAIEVARTRFLAEDKVKQLERWLATTLHSIGDAVIVANMAGEITLMNPVAEVLTGWSSSAALGAPLAQVFQLELDGELRAGPIVASVLESGGVLHVNGNARVRTKSGSHVPVDDSIARTHDEHGEPTGVVVVFRDRSAALASEEQRRQLEARMYDAQRLESLGVLAGGVAHDFNNLLGVILGNASLLRARAPMRPDREVCVQNIEQAARRGADLCTQMLAYAGLGHFALEDIDLNALITSTVQLLQISIGKNVKLQLSLAQDLPLLRGDPSRIQQVLMNLIINAAEALSGRSGDVLVRTQLSARASAKLGQPAPRSPEQAYVTLEIEDTGEGMSEDTCKRIFDPFFTTKFQGRGLGLAAVRGIVESHHGSLTVRSKVGQGSTFAVHLPASSTRASAEAKPEPKVGSKLLSGRALVVDDEEPMRSISRALLEAVGMEVEEASCAEEAMDIVALYPRRFAVVLMDWTMPGQSGTEAAHSLEKIAPGLPVILMSGYTEESMRRAQGARNVAAYLGKPFSLDDLRAKLVQILKPRS